MKCCGARLRRAIASTSLVLSGLHVALACAVLFAAGPTQAQTPDRRPGLWGVYSARRLTMPKNSLGLISGPLQSALFGQRYGSYAPEGGVSYEGDRARDDGAHDELWLRGGVVFGLTPQLEAGALFLSFRFTPDFSYSNFPVFVTYHWSFDRVDLGAKFSFLTPVEEKTWAFNPGLPVSVRFDGARLDTGLYVPILTGDLSAGLNLPLRITFNLTPRWFMGAESGVYEAAFGQGPGASSNLGGHLGYTTVFGKQLIDFAARFHWDDFLRYDPAAGERAITLGRYQVFLGATFHSKVM